MCRWLTYCGDPIYLDKVLFEPRNSLISQSLRARHSHVTTNGDGFGIGWYGERPTPGVYRDILPAWNDQNLKSLCAPDPLRPVPGACARLDRHRDLARQLPSVRPRQVAVHA